MPVCNHLRTQHLGNNSRSRREDKLKALRISLPSDLGLLLSAAFPNPSERDPRPYSTTKHKMIWKFRLGHIPALYFAFANCVGLVMTPLGGTSSVISLYGLPPRIANVPETWPVWQAGQGRIVLLGLLMQYFYWRRQYAECDTLLMGVAWLGIVDFFVAFNYGDSLLWAWCRLLFSFAFASTGYFGMTQGSTAGRAASH